MPVASPHSPATKLADMVIPQHLNDATFASLQHHHHHPSSPHHHLGGSSSGGGHLSSSVPVSPNRPPYDPTMPPSSSSLVLQQQPIIVNNFYNSLPPASSSQGHQQGMLNHADSTGSLRQASTGGGADGGMVGGIVLPLPPSLASTNHGSFRLITPNNGLAGYGGPMQLPQHHQHPRRVSLAFAKAENDACSHCYGASQITRVAQEATDFIKQQLQNNSQHNLSNVDNNNNTDSGLDHHLFPVPCPPPVPPPGGLNGEKMQTRGSELRLSRSTTSNRSGGFESPTALTAAAASAAAGGGSRFSQQQAGQQQAGQQQDMNSGSVVGPDLGNSSLNNGGGAGGAGPLGGVTGGSHSGRFTSSLVSAGVSDALVQDEPSSWSSGGLEPKSLSLQEILVQTTSTPLRNSQGMPTTMDQSTTPMMHQSNNNNRTGNNHNNVTLASFQSTTTSPQLAPSDLRPSSDHNLQRLASLPSPLAIGSNVNNNSQLLNMSFSRIMRTDSLRSQLRNMHTDRLLEYAEQLTLHLQQIQDAVENRLLDPCTCGTVAVEEVRPDDREEQNESPRMMTDSPPIRPPAHYSNVQQQQQAAAAATQQQHATGGAGGTSTSSILAYGALAGGPSGSSYTHHPQQSQQSQRAASPNEHSLSPRTSVSSTLQHMAGGLAPQRSVTVAPRPTSGSNNNHRKASVETDLSDHTTNASTVTSSPTLPPHAVPTFGLGHTNKSRRTTVTIIPKPHRLRSQVGFAPDSNLDRHAGGGGAGSPRAQRIAHIEDPSAALVPFIAFDPVDEPPREILKARKSLIMSTTVAHETDDISGFEMVNQYLVMEEIGAGCSGVVFAVCNTETNKDFAMKVIKRDRFAGRRTSLPGAGGGAVASQSSNREVAIMKKLRHPHVVRLHEVIDDAACNKLYLIMSLLTGGQLCPSLDAATGECEPVASDLMRRYVYQMCDGLRYLHQHNIIHRDVKPENMMLDAEGNVVLVDFGVSEQVANEQGDVEGAVGTPAFMAPEVWDGDRVSGAAADVWSLGVSVFMMLVGHSPYYAKNRTELIEKIRTRGPAFPDDMDPEWRSLLKAMLTKDPATRISLSAVMRNKMFAEFREADPLFQRPSNALRGAIVVTEDDLQSAIAERADFQIVIREGDESAASQVPGVVAANVSPYGGGGAGGPSAAGGINMSYFGPEYMSVHSTYAFASAAGGAAAAAFGAHHHFGPGIIGSTCSAAAMLSFFDSGAVAETGAAASAGGLDVPNMPHVASFGAGRVSPPPPTHRGPGIINSVSTAIFDTASSPVGSTDFPGSTPTNGGGGPSVLLCVPEEKILRARSSRRLLNEKR